MTSPDCKKLSSIFKVSPILEHPPSPGESFLVIAPLGVFADASVTSEELERASLIKSEESRNRFLAGRRLLRSLYSRWTGKACCEIPILIDAMGKPFLSTEELPGFSISHSGDLVTLLVTYGEGGVDLEKERRLDFQNLARRFFSEEEALSVESSLDPAHFFKLWTCREAAIKADGRGMGSLLKGMGSCMGEECVRVRAGGRGWNAFPWSLSGGYHGAVAFAESPRVILWCDLR